MRWEPDRSAPALPYTPPDSFWTAVWRGARNRCPVCGRSRGFMRKFGICRICFRDMASKGKLPGVTKSSW